MTTPSTDAVAQAREKYERCVLEARFSHEHQGPSEIAAAVENLDCAWAEVLAAVSAQTRAECAADTKRLDWLETQANNHLADPFNAQHGWLFWQSENGRGPRVATTSRSPNHNSVREALDAARESAR